MLKQKILKWFAVVATSLLLTACSGGLVCVPETTVVDNGSSGGERPSLPPRSGINDNLPSNSAGGNRGLPEDFEPVPTANRLIDNPSGPGKVAVDSQGYPIPHRITFNYDEAVLSSESRRLLADHAEVMRLNPDQRIMVEGHCDERGTREYNLALGERRANVVTDFFLANGIRSSRLDSRSFGEEQPIDPASNETAWALNRRVEVKYY